MATIADRKRSLETRLKELGVRLHDIEEELEMPHTRDWDDLAIEREGDEVLSGLGISGQAEIRAINVALERIGAGTYGICAGCAEEISKERLDVLPYAALCKTCATERSDAR